jgi:hypothetical protein|tara:strand:+ start:3551 stop:5116 length:1566 start_codon:yes stop_codon:yes gene_type:complete
MYRILTASKDTYITNKIISNNFRATDANVGQAATLDLFKLYGESTSGSNASPIEISRALVKFNLDPIRRLTGSFLDIGHSSFKCTLKLFDTYGGQTVPSNFKLIVFPMSRSFDEGIGMNVVDFSDLDSCNFLTASVTGTTPALWYHSGANKQGFLGSSDIDIISSGTLSGSSDTQNINLWAEQTFSTGEEDLSIDVTRIISGTLNGLIPDHGFRISYSGSEETDKTTRFVKRFSSAQSSNYAKRPRLVVQYNNTVQDHHDIFLFNVSGSLFMNNVVRGSYKNILSGASATKISGNNSLILRLRSGSSARGTFFQKIITASQHKMGNNFITGAYSASFALSEFTSSNNGEVRFNGALASEIKNAGSATFTEIWESLDGTVGYLTSSFVINSTKRTSFNNQSRRLIVNVTNMQPEYKFNDVVRFRVFVEDVDRPVKYKKIPFVTDSQIFTSMYYRVRDWDSDEVIIPFDTSGGTLCSTDSDGMYFDIYMDSLFKGRLYVLDFLIKDQGFDQTFTHVSSKFRIV